MSAFSIDTRMGARIEEGLLAINKLGGVMSISATPAYRATRLEELRLRFSDGREERNRARETARVKEIRARQKAETEEQRYEKELDKARREIAQASDLRWQTS